MIYPVIKTKRKEDVDEPSTRTEQVRQHGTIWPFVNSYIEGRSSPFGERGLPQSRNAQRMAFYEIRYELYNFSQEVLGSAE